MADNNQAVMPQAAQEKKEEKPKQPSTLENAVNESWNFIKGTTNAFVGTGATVAATALFGLNGLVTTLSFPYGGRISTKLAGKEFSTARFRDEAIAGALFTPPLWYGVQAVKQMPKAFGLEGTITNILGASVPVSPLVVGGLTLGVLTPALNALYYPLQYIIRNKTFKGIGKDFRENYWKGTLRALPLTVLTSAAVGASYALPAFAPYLFPVIAVGSVLYRILLSKEGKIDYKRFLYPSTYLPNVLNPFYLASGAVSASGKIYRGITSAAYSLGSWLDSLLSSTVAPSTPAPAAKKEATKTAPAPTQAPAVQPG